MKFSSIVLGIALMGTTTLAAATDTCCHDHTPDGNTELIREMNRDFESALLAQAAPADLDVRTLEVEEAECPVDLGFDTAAYLPLAFDAYAGKIASHNVPELHEVETEIELGFDTTPYLPEGFDPFQGMNLPAGSNKELSK